MTKSPRGALGELLAHPGLPSIYVATLLGTGGQWIQNVVLAAYAYDTTGSAVAVGLVVLAQLGPLLLFGVPAGAIADQMNRRTLLRVAVAAQAVAAAVVALASSVDGASLIALIVPVVGCGIAQTLFLSSYTSLLPFLVPRSDLRRALSLNSGLLSIARVLGPAIGAVLYAAFGHVLPLALVAALYSVVVASTGRIPRLATAEPRPKMTLRGLGVGFQVARRDPEVGRILVTISTFSLICLPFLNQLPLVAAENLGVGTRDGAYSLMFVATGIGALVGGLMVGTVFLNVDMDTLSRLLLWAFGAFLMLLALAHSLAVGLLLMGMLGFAYYGVSTTLVTRLQIHLSDDVRGRVMALWFMGFGGLMPVGAALSGPLIDVTSISVVLLVGAVAAVPLGWYIGRRPRPNNPLQTQKETD